MEIFDRMQLTEDSLTNPILLNKNDYIKFLRKEQTFKKIDQLNIYHEESRKKELLNFYNDYRNTLKVKKYIKILKSKIEKTFYPPKLFLDQLEDVKKNMHDLQEFEKKLFLNPIVSEIDSDESEVLRKSDEDKKKKFNKEKEKISTKKNKFKNPIINTNNIVDFIRNNEEFISRYLKFKNIKKSKSKEKKLVKKQSKEKLKVKKMQIFNINLNFSYAQIILILIRIFINIQHLR